MTYFVNSLQAFSISRPLAERLCRAPCSLTLVSLHAEALNLSTGERLLSLVTAAVGNGPFHVVLPDLPSQQQTDRDLVVGRLAWPQMQILDCLIDLSSADRWDPSLTGVGGGHPNAFQDVDTYVPDAGRVSLPGTLEAGCHAGLERGVRGLRCFLADGRSTSLTAAIATLVGLGAGLTPAGDDLLLGFLARCWLQPAVLGCGWSPDRVGRLVAATCSGRTTRLSAAWIHHAGRGEFGERWHLLRDAFEYGERGERHLAVQMLLETGATSGRDAWLGFTRPFRPGCGDTPPAGR